MAGLYDIGLKCVSEEDLDKIHAASIRILENKGIVVHHDEVREIAKKKGAKVDDKVVYFPKSLVEKAVETAPEYFEFQSRNKEKNIIIGKDLVLSPVHGVPFIIDENGRRQGTLEDYLMLIKLSHQLNSLNLTGGIVIEPYDVDRNIRHVELMHHLAGISVVRKAGDVLCMRNRRGFVDQHAGNHIAFLECREEPYVLRKTALEQRHFLVCMGRSGAVLLEYGVEHPKEGL